MLRPLAACHEAPAYLVRAAANDLQISERWAYKLIRRLREEGGAVTAILPRSGRGAPRKSRIPRDREAVISKVIEGWYLKRQKERPSEIVFAGAGCLATHEYASLDASWPCSASEFVDRRTKQ